MRSMYKFGKRQPGTKQDGNEPGWRAMTILLAIAKWIRNCGPDRSDGREELCEEHFPANASGRDIVGHQGTVIATAADSAIAEEIAQRLNESEWRRHEDLWAL